MRALGGIPVRRDRRNNLVAQVAEAFASASDLALVVPAEGTRGRTEYWKSGFYHMARTAKVPIVCGYLDYARKRGGFGHEFEPSGDVARDMDVVRAFYADKVGKYPECFGPVRLRDESMSADHAGV
jgi:1-acyl-sn-glycerol-3-phosphate acyltransferase